MMLAGAVSWLWAAAVASGYPGDGDQDGRFGCRPIPEVAPAVRALNAFWDDSVRLCETSDPRESAAAEPDEGIVLANRRWLAEIARDYGAPAAIGILAHEWTHVVQRMRPGRMAELQADCVAGAFLSRAGYGEAALEGFALLSLHSGDEGSGRRTHGSGRERRAAVLRGYHDVDDPNPWRVLAACQVKGS